MTINQQIALFVQAFCLISAIALVISGWRVSRRLTLLRKMLNQFPTLDVTPELHKLSIWSKINWRCATGLALFFVSYWATRGIEWLTN